MHILLTDLLTCPRCGPDFGLIVLSERMADRHVLDGSLGCANCRSTYPVRDRKVDLRCTGCGDLTDSAVPPADPDRSIRLAALLGVTRANATLLVLERSGAAASGLAPLIPDVHVIGGTGEDTSDDEDPALGILSRVRLAARLPFRTGSLAGVAAVGIDVRNLLGELRRILRPDGRMVVEGGTEDLAGMLPAAGFEVHLEQDGVVVASPMSRS